jgi:3-hydroxy-9,10-secoandrosta-1,3,5(10)-triene-9,17-dione monooxygenase
MPESDDPHQSVREILDAAVGEPIAALRNSGAGRILQPPQYGGLGLPCDEFVWVVCELAAINGSLGWLAAIYNVAAQQIAGLSPHAAHGVWDANPDALIAIGHRSSGDLVDGRLTGRWGSVVGAEQADWLLLPAGGVSHVLVPRSQVVVEAVEREVGLTAAGVGDVVVGDLTVDEGRVFTGSHQAGVVVGAGAAAAVVGSADGVWRKHVEQLRARLDISYGGDEVTDEAAAAVARAASDIDASKLQITGALDSVADELATATTAFAQSVARARGAANRLLASSRHALDASDPVTNRWRDVYAGYRLAVRIIDGLSEA